MSLSTLSTLENDIILILYNQHAIKVQSGLWQQFCNENLNEFSKTSSPDYLILSEAREAAA